MQNILRKSQTVQIKKNARNFFVRDRAALILNGVRGAADTAAAAAAAVKKLVPFVPYLTLQIQNGNGHMAVRILWIRFQMRGGKLL